MKIKVVSKRNGPGGMKNELVQLSHHVVPLGIEYLTAEPFNIRNHRDLNVVRRSKAAKNWAQLIIILSLT